MSLILGFKFRTFNCILLLLLLHFIGKLFMKNQNLGLEVERFYMYVYPLFHCKYTTSYFFNDKHIKQHC
jgi:hypothetical protein